MSAGRSLALGEATSSFGDRRADLTASVHYDLGDGMGVKGYVAKGLADGSPDYALCAMFELKF